MEPLDHNIKKSEHIVRVVYLYPPNKNNNYCIILAEYTSNGAVELGDKYYYSHQEYKVVKLGEPKPSCNGYGTLTVHYAHKVGEDRTIDNRTWWDKIKDKVIIGFGVIVTGTLVGLLLYKLSILIKLVVDVLLNSD